MNKHPSQYTPYDIYDLETRLLKLAAETGGEKGELIREGASLLLNQAIRIAQIRLALEVR